MRKVTLFLLVLMVVLPSCGPVTAVPSVTQMATVGVAATEMPTTTPSPTATPFWGVTLSQVDMIFVLPPYSRPEVTPTPFVTPSVDYSSMRLRDLSEDESLAFIDELNRYSYQYFPPLMGWASEGQFVESQIPVALAIQEYLYRFPESITADRLRWQLAFFNSIRFSWNPGSQYDDEWMLGELQKWLNQGDAHPDQLEKFFQKYSFDVVYVQSIENLFNDSKTGWLYVISPRVWEDEKSGGRGRLFFVVREVSKGKFQPHLLMSAWGFTTDMSYVFDISDHNQNGTPEIALFHGYQSGSMCGGSLLIYEWKEKEFMELTEGNISLRECADDFEYSQNENPPSIVVSKVFPVHIKELYRWNGKFYEFAGFVDASALTEWQFSLFDPSFSYAEETELISEILESGSWMKFGPTFPDFLRYRLGIAYAMQSMHGEAINELQRLVLSPNDKTTAIFSEAAQKFLENYDGDASIYNACKLSSDVFATALDPYRDENGNASFYDHQDLLGFPINSISSLHFLTCDIDDAFVIMIRSIPLTLYDLPAKLRRNGVDLKYIQKLDANFDGTIDDWLVDINTDGWRGDAYLVFPTDSHYQAKSLGGGLSHLNGAYSSVQLNVEYWDYFQSPVLITFADGTLYLWKINNANVPEDIFFDRELRDFVISNTNSLPQFQVFYTMSENDLPELPWMGGRWDTKQNAFANDLLEYTLFVLHEPQKAVEIVDRILPLLQDLKNAFLQKDKDIYYFTMGPLPYTYYLAGLSYELSGDQQKAAQVYWQLWHDFPDSPYAIMAQYKLESVRP